MGLLGRPALAQGGVEVVRLGCARRDHPVPAGREVRRRGGRQPQADLVRAARGDLDHVVQRGLRPGPRRVHRRGAVDHVVVDAVLGIRGSGLPPEALGVRRVVAEQRARRRRRSRAPSCRAPRAAPRARPAGDAVIAGAATPSRQLQVSRNQSVGSTCSVAASGPAVRDGDADADVVRHPPWRSRPPRRSSGPRRRRRCRAARTRGRAGRGARSPRRGRRTGTRAADRRSASASRSGWASSRRTTSTP